MQISTLSKRADFERDIPGQSMSTYFIAQISIHDREGYRLYEEGFDEVFARFQGKVLIVDDHPTVLEGEFRHSRIVVIKFPGETEARQWYESAEYQTLARHRFQASKADTIFASGRE
jgi:uncharacterized protein (DUF1330 family)